jgi:mRNA-degrading endonuclease RelE of RelBE toxin-antitoxin system
MMDWAEKSESRCSGFHSVLLEGLLSAQVVIQVGNFVVGFFVDDDKGNVFLFSVSCPIDESSFAAADVIRGPLPV